MTRLKKLLWRPALTVRPELPSPALATDQITLLAKLQHVRSEARRR